MISVCIATYNGEKYILDQLATVLPQLGPADEVVISDDSSTDATLAKIRSLNDPRIKIYGDQRFRSPIFNFEHALKKASNDYLVMCDQDDLWADGKIAAIKEAFAKGYDMVVCDHSVIDDDKNVLIPSYFAAVPSKPGIIHNMKKNTYYGCCMAFHKKVLQKASPFPKDIPMHDIWLGFVADMFFKSVFIPYPYTMYRKHGNNVTTATDVNSSSSLKQKLMNRWNYLKYLPALLLR